jgi:hypothetical protein
MKIVLWVFLAYLVGMLVFFVGPELSQAWCQHRWSQSGLSARWTFGVGCMVQVNGNWVPQANVQISN